MGSLPVAGYNAHRLNRVRQRRRLGVNAYRRAGICASAVAAVTLSAGCSSFEISKPEIAWQALHAIDVAQTINGPAKDPCFAEGTVTRHLIGEQPSTEGVLAWGIGLSLVHYQVDRWLEKTGRDKQPFWRIVRSIDIGYKGYTVARNHDLGVRPFGANDCPWR